MAIDIKNLVKLETLMKLPLKKKVLVLAGVNILLLVLLYQFLFSPKVSEISTLKDKLDTIQRKLDNDRAIAMDIPRYKREKNELEASLKKALEQLPNEKEIDGLLDSIYVAGEEVGLKILLFKPQSDIPKGFYAEVPVEMEVEGGYESIFGFCKRVGKLPRIVNVGKLSIETDKKGEMTLSPKLKAAFTVTTFRFIPGAGLEQEGKGKKKKK